jgi:PST family polysaccharide transporter
MITATKDIRFCTDHLQADLTGRTARSGMITIVSQFVRFVLNLLAVMVMARLLLPVEYGLIAMVAPITGFVGLFKDLGLSTATIQKAHITHEQVSVLFWVNVTVSIGLAVLCLAISPLVGIFYQDSRTMWITMALASSFIFGGLTAQHHALLRRQMLFVTLGWIDIVTSVVSIVVGIATAWWGWSYWSLVTMTLSGAAVNCAAVWSVNSWRPGRPCRGSGVRELLRFGRSLTVSQVFNFISGNMDKLLIGKTLGAGALGIYNRAFQLLLMPMEQVFSPLSSVLLASLSRVSDDPARFRRAVRTAGDLLLMTVAPLVAAMIVFAQEMVLVFLGPAWLEAVPIFRALAVVALVLPMNYLGAIILQAAGRTDVMMKWAPVAMVISVASILVGMPWGLIGIATAWAFGVLVLRSPIFYFIISRTTPIALGDILAPLLTYALPCALLVLGGCWWGHTLPFKRPLWTLLVGGLILVASYVTYLCLIGKHKHIIALARHGGARPF